MGWALLLVVVCSGLVDISAVEDAEEELVHWVWGCDSENLSNVEGAAGKKKLNQFSKNHPLTDKSFTERQHLCHR